MLYVPNFFGLLFSTGGGGGAVAVVVVDLGGGFAFSRRGPLWARITAGVPIVGLVGLFAFGVTTDIEVMPSQEALPGLVGLTFVLLMVLWIAACSTPHKEVTPAEPGGNDRRHFS